MRKILASAHWGSHGLMVATLALTAAMYARTLQPTLGGMFNSAEYQHAAYALGLVHPTGYPLYLLLAKVWVTLIPVGDVAFRMNLFSALWACGATCFAWLIIQLLTRSALASTLGALFFATNEAVWRYASVAEVDTFTGFLAGGLIYLLLLWRTGRTPLELAAFFYGLALAHHRTSLFYLPGIIVFVLLAHGSGKRSLKIYARSVLLMLVPLTLYLYLPVRGAATGEPFANPEHLLGYILGISSGTGNLVASIHWLERFELIYHQYLWDGFLGAGIVLALLGAWRWRPYGFNSDRNSILLLLLLIFVCVTLFTIPYGQADIDRYLIVPVMILAIWSGCGAAWVATVFRRDEQESFVTKFVGACVLALLFLLPLMNIVSNLPKVDFSQNTRTRQFWDEIFHLPLADQAIVIGSWDDLNAMRYMQRVEGLRLDLKPVGTARSPEESRAQLEQGLAQNRTVYVTPWFPLESDQYHVYALGPLRQVATQVQRQAPTPPVVMNENWGSLNLVGYALNVALQAGTPAPTVSLVPNQTVRVTLYFQVKKAPSRAWIVRTRLLDAKGQNLWEKMEAPVQATYPTTRWRKGELVIDNHAVLVPPGTSPGNYQIEVGLIDEATKQLVEPAVRLGGVRVERSPALLADQVFVQNRKSVAWESIELIGFNGGSQKVKRGQELKFALAWMAISTPARAYKFRLRLVDVSGQIWQEADLSLVQEFPTTQWRRGDAFKEYYSIVLDKDAPPGPAMVQIILLDEIANPSPPTNSRLNAVELFSFVVVN